MLAASTLARIAARRLRNKGSAASPANCVLRAQRQVGRHQQVGGGAQAALPHVHQREGEVVEEVAGGDVGVELDSVDQRGWPSMDRDVARVQVAVAAARVARGTARDQQPPRRGERFARLARQRGGAGGGANRSGRSAKAASF